MNKKKYLNILRSLSDVSPFTAMMNEVYDKNENNRYYHAYDCPCEFRDNQILFLADCENNRFRRERDCCIRKKHGGLRQLTAPVGRMRELLMCVNDVLTALYVTTPWAYGFVPRRSVVDNAKVHVGKRYVLNIDIRDFFPSISVEQVRSCLMAEPYRFSEYAAGLIAGLCVVSRDGRKRLAQGFHTSPIVSNMVCASMDEQLADLAKQTGAVYSRYADDMTFSSDDDVLNVDGSFFQSVKSVVEQHGFALNDKKTRWQTRGKNRQEVTGLNVTEKVNVSRGYMREIRSQLYIWERYGYAELCRAAYPHYKVRHGKTKGHMRHVNMAHVLDGKIAYLGMVRGKEDAFYVKCNERLRRLMADNRKEINRVNRQAYKDARERFDAWIRHLMESGRCRSYATDNSVARDFHNPQKSGKLKKVLIFILFVIAYLILRYLQSR